MNRIEVERAFEAVKAGGDTEILTGVSMQVVEDIFMRSLGKNALEMVPKAEVDRYLKRALNNLGKYQSYRDFLHELSWWGRNMVTKVVAERSN